MAYASLADLKTYLGAGTIKDDTLLADLLTRAQKAIETFCDRTFESSEATRYYNAGDILGSNLYTGKDLLEITTLTNGDGSGIDSDSYVLLPRNEGPPYKIIRLKSSYCWSFTDSDSEIEVGGTWGFATAAPSDIEHATLRLAAYFYRQKDAQVFDTTAMPDIGMIQVPQGIPRDVRIILTPYRKLGIGVV